MATRGKKLSAAAESLSILDGIDLVEFNRQKTLIAQKANEAIAERVQTIRTALNELQQIVEVSGVSVNVSNMISEFEDARESLDPNTDWNSSSAYC